MKATGPSDEGGKSVSAKASKPEQPATVRRTHRHSRRAFLSRTSGLAVATWSASALGLNLLASPQAHAAASTAGDHQRVTQCFSLRREAALRDRNLGTPSHVSNGDEATHPNRIGNYSKGLPHNSIGEVDLAAYDSLVRAVTTGDPSDFENVTLGGNTPLVNPQAGLAFDMEGLDAYQFAIPPAPALASAERAGEAVECYWMALLRDVNFTQYDSHALALQAAAELSTLSDFRGPKVNGQVTPATLFRGSAAGDLVGPHVSQFLLQPLGYGVLTIDQKFNTYLAGLDYLTTPAAWLSVRNGNSPSLLGSMDPVLRYARNGRDLAAYVHVDVLFEAYFNACLWLLNHGAPLSLGNPYLNSQNQTGFGTFGAPHIATLVAEVSTRALKAVWYQKWFVHRALRPEEYGGLVHFTRTGQANHPLHPEALNSAAIDLTYSRFGSYLLPMAFPEGCPQHPAYGAGTPPSPGPAPLS